jgi:hypothetical protein
VISHAASYLCSSVLGAIRLWRLDTPFPRFRRRKAEPAPAVAFEHVQISPTAEGFGETEPPTTQDVSEVHRCAQAVKAS